MITIPILSRRLLIPALVLVLGLGPAPRESAGSGAGGGGSSSEPPTSTPESEMSPEERASLARRSAEETYDKFFAQTEKAGEEMAEARTLKAAGETSTKKAADLRESAIKRYRKAIDGFKKAVKLDPGFHEAWNMLGYSYRKTGQLGEAFKAYETCLKLNPDYDLAHEYLGEARLQAGDIDQAKAELAWLTEHKSPEAAVLEAAIARVVSGETAFLGTEW